MSVEDITHPPAAAVPCAVLTVSDTRTAATDTAGAAIGELLTAAGHSIVTSRLVGDEPGEVAAIVTQWARSAKIRAIVTTGGTGIARRDTTVEAIARLFTTSLPGFGELFRMLSYQDIGPAAMLSRATAGLVDRTVVFVLPGSEVAVRLAVTRLIVPQLGHLARELEK